MINVMPTGMQKNFNTNQTTNTPLLYHTYNFYDQNGNLFSFPFYFFRSRFSATATIATAAAYYRSASKKTGWTEEQEAELRQLFMENQNNPSTEKGNYNIYTQCR